MMGRYREKKAISMARTERGMGPVFTAWEEGDLAPELVSNFQPPELRDMNFCGSSRPVSGAVRAG